MFLWYNSFEKGKNHEKCAQIVNFIAKFDLLDADPDPCGDLNTDPPGSGSEKNRSVGGSMG